MSYAAFELLTNIQREIVEHLTKQEYFARVPIIAEDVGKDYNTLIEDRIEQALGDVSAGLVGVVVPTAARDAAGEVPGIYFNRVDVVIRWLELPAINRVNAGTKVLAPWAAAAACYYLSPFNFRPVTFAALTPDDPPLVRTPDDAKIIYDCNFFTHGGVETTT
jgi:hypothetical protein